MEFACSSRVCMCSLQVKKTNMHVRLTGDSKLTLGVSVSVPGCLSCLSPCGPVMNWRLVQGVPLLSPNDSWDKLQPHRNPKLD